MTVVDLFCGAGGLSLGFAAAGCVSILAVEVVDDRGEEEAKNLLGMMIEERRLRDISDLPLDLAV